MPKVPPTKRTRTTPIRPSQPPAQKTSTSRNRCRLDEVTERHDLNVDREEKFHPDIVKEIIIDHWTLPLWSPSRFPDRYPPQPPLLGQRLPEDVAQDLREAFTQNNVTYATPGVRGNLILELFGDKYMASLLADCIQRDLDMYGDSSVYRSLDLGGMDVSPARSWSLLSADRINTAQIVFRQICCGVQQSFFAMMYNFPARITLAYKESPFHHRQLFSQRDLEGTFEAYIAVCRKHVSTTQLQLFFAALIAPWIPGIIDQALQFQRNRDGADGIESSLASTNKAKYSLLERRPAQPRFVGKLPYVIEPTLRVSHRPHSASRSG